MSGERLPLSQAGGWPATAAGAGAGCWFGGGDRRPRAAPNCFRSLRNAGSRPGGWVTTRWAAGAKCTVACLGGQLLPIRAFCVTAANPPRRSKLTTACSTHRRPRSAQLHQSHPPNSSGSHEGKPHAPHRA